MKIVRKLTIIALVIIIISSCGTNNNQDETQNADIITSKEKLAVFEIINRLPVYKSGTRLFYEFGFTTFKAKIEGQDEKTVGEAINVSDSILTFFTNSVSYIEENDTITDIPLSQRKNNMIYLSSDDVRVDFYCVLDINNSFVNVLASVNEFEKGEVAYTDWLILSIRKDGQIVSVMKMFNNLYLNDKEIISLWHYANDPETTYQLFRQNENGIFDMYSSSMTIPNGVRGLEVEI